MPEAFCTVCNYSGVLRSERQTVGFVFTFFFAIIGFVLFVGGGVGCASIAVLLGVVTAVGGYNSFNHYCAMCGSRSFLPSDSPKALEFQQRAKTFDYLEQRIPEPVIDAGPAAEFVQDPVSSSRLPGPRRRS